ncbi:hypothetical protein [Nocardia miyunensis]|uniref:hypothetical protein n=1 Tax=Nocardia miyunensis TaxID=282684 RepID=UPI00082DBCDA|nr:hypothetical protein [Nocardia miyunensis]
MLADERAFQQNYMVPIEMTVGRRSVSIVEDAGVRPVDRAAISGLSPAVTEGVHTGASQTHPADGAADALVTTAGTSA